LSKQKAKKESTSFRGLGWFVEIATNAIDKLSLPGFFIILLAYVFVIFATHKQKEEFIDLYILGKGMQGYTPFWVILILFALILFAQRALFNKRERVLRDEIERLGAWKTAHQEMDAERNLRHTRNKQ
jgi:hypothetical protein